MESSQPDTTNVKRLIWLYFGLLIFEGALRKWVVPGLSTPLLIIRDPVVVLIYATAMAEGVFPKTPIISLCAALAVMNTATSFAGVGNWKVTLFGLRADFLHIPLIFVLPQVFNIRDVRKMGRAFLWLSFLMAPIAIKQFRASPDAWINVGAGGQVGGQLFAGAGRIRPSGLFSFVTGMVSYLAAMTSFLLESFLRGSITRWSLPFFAIPTLTITLAVSGSRSAIASVALVLFAGMIACLRLGIVGKTLLPIVGGFLAYLFLSLFNVLQEGIGVLQQRYEGGGGLQDGIIMRFFGDLSSGIQAAFWAPFLGNGIGVGTNAGAGILTGAAGFLLAESEWSRVVLESGPILGFAFIFLRIGIGIHVALVAWKALAVGNTLPILLLGASGLELVSGQWGQPTILGFAVLLSGLALAAAKEEQEPATLTAPVTAPPPKKHWRARAPYAESLHRDP